MPKMLWKSEVAKGAFIPTENGIKSARAAGAFAGGWRKSAGTVEKMLPLRVDVGTMRKTQCQQCGKRKMVMRYVVEEENK